ncbi:hypothetical protein BC827DRAFT_1377170 [Russula dissimulans]|nr:hypothetical protein BC827DRAFT_1377170 [Russula dissimulans]
MANHQDQELPPETPQQGKLWLILYEPSDGPGNFYLDIPIYVIEPLCLRPRKYLRYLGWCVLGIEGHVILGDQDIGDEGGLVDQGVYHYVVNATGFSHSPLTDNRAAPLTIHTLRVDPLARAIDLEVIKQRSTIISSESAHSGSSSTRNNFLKDLVERDGTCVFSGFPFVEGVHIIPYARGDEWFQLIISNRHAYDEDVSDLLSINDIRNGLLVQATLHNLIDSRQLVILQTPNHVLDIDDVPWDSARSPLWDPAEYEDPVDERFSLQSLGDLHRSKLLHVYPNNTTAAFKRGTNLPKPSPLILHYNYGAAVVKLWGRRTEVLDRPNVPRPRVVKNHQPDGPSRGRNNRLTAIRKREARNNTGVSSGEVGEVVGDGATDTTDNPTVVTQPMVGYRGWDEDDWMLFFWGNTPAARERHRAAEEESSDRIARWTFEVSNTALVEPPSQA